MYNKNKFFENDRTFYNDYFHGGLAGMFSNDVTDDMVKVPPVTDMADVTNYGSSKRAVPSQYGYGQGTTPPVAPVVEPNNDVPWSAANKINAVSGLANFGLGLLSYFQGNDALDLQRKSVNHNIALSKKNYKAKATQYNNQLGRGAGSRASVSGGKDPMSRIDRTV